MRRGDNMRKLVVFLDYESDYSDRVEKIKKDAKNEVEYYYIEDFTKNRIKEKIKPEDIIYFLTNVKEIKSIIKKLPRNRILNEKYYINDLSKIEIQNKLSANGVTTPRIIEYSDKFTNNDFPLYVKNKNHDVFVAKICSKRSYNLFFTKFNKKDFYLEEEIKSVDIIKEHKIYYSNNAIFENDKDEISTKIKRICNKVARITGLDVYSADLIETKKKIYVVDVNSAPGFWNSKESRLKLLEYCEK